MLFTPERPPCKPGSQTALVGAPAEERPDTAQYRANDAWLRTRCVSPRTGGEARANTLQDAST